MKYVVDITDGGDYVTVDDRGAVRAVERVCVKVLTAFYRLGLKGIAKVEIDGKRAKFKSNK